jgi:putative Mg2+ transporter-C (MgtC) family protein
MQLTIRLLVALVLTWSIGFERELRGSAAGDRTFSLIGLGSAVVGYLALDGAPNALAGVVTGIGFIGAGVIVHGTRPNRPLSPSSTDMGELPNGSADDGMSVISGVTTAATIYVAAAVGAAAGQGALLLATEATVATLLLLEVRHVRWMRWLDGRYWRNRLRMSDDGTGDWS